MRRPINQYITVTTLYEGIKLKEVFILVLIVSRHFVQYVFIDLAPLCPAVTNDRNKKKKKKKKKMMM